jgi:exopolyphosphatase/guanosine-5'-triphosphate,3'-diphosphate pyrophosphatase
MTRLAVIDCGTNTFNLLIIELNESKPYTKLLQTRLSVKLGEHSINKGFISESAYERGIEALGIYKKQCERYQVDHILAFATSAIRDAGNGQLFVEEIATRFAISIQVIDGNKEAELIYFGNKEAVALKEEPSLIMDIGGGSNEFIIANKHEILWKGSFNIGAARILEKFKFSDPASSQEIQALTNYLTEELYTLTSAVNKFKPFELIGSSGAFDTFIDMIHAQLSGEPLLSDKTEYTLKLSDYSTIASQIKQSTLAERKKMNGLVPMRVDMIVISCVMIDMILNTYQLKNLRVSTYSLKEGALMEYLSNFKN